jgi:hypothetical protein
MSLCKYGCKQPGIKKLTSGEWICCKYPSLQIWKAEKLINLNLINKSGEVV